MNGGVPLFEEGRRLYTEEVNAAVRGARAGGATEVVVVDCHGAGKAWNFNSLVPELLDAGCEWVCSLSSSRRWTNVCGTSKPRRATVRTSTDARPVVAPSGLAHFTHSQPNGRALRYASAATPKRNQRPLPATAGGYLVYVSPPISVDTTERVFPSTVTTAW